jgi:hypothetical protein
MRTHASKGKGFSSLPFLQTPECGRERELRSLATGYPELTPGRRPASDLIQPLQEIVDQVVLVLEADRDPDKSVG